MNDMVSVEIAAVSEYQQHAYLSKDPSIIDMLEDFSMDEMSHIEWCSREVARLGGIPTVIPKKLEPPTKNTKTLLERDVRVEALAMKRLKEYINIAEEEGELRIKRLLENIYADEEVHHNILKGLLTPPKSLWGKTNKHLDIGLGLILTGVFWLYLWLFPHFPAFIEDPRWAHNFAYPLILITLGIAYKGRKMSTDLIAAISTFMIIPTETGVITGIQSTTVSAILLVITGILIGVEKGRDQELLFFDHRWRRWLKKHLLALAFLFLIHMAFIYWFTRVLFGDPFAANLPPEPPWEPSHWGTALYNVLVIPFGVIGMGERFRGTLRRHITTFRIGYWWSLLIIITGILGLGIASGAWHIYGGPLAISILILIVSIRAYTHKNRANS
jgi:bacterioferritin